jgi:hypothetical protein
VIAADSSLRAKRSNPDLIPVATNLDCFVASLLAMTAITRSHNNRCVVDLSDSHVKELRRAPAFSRQDSPE